MQSSLADRDVVPSRATRRARRPDDRSGGAAVQLERAQPASGTAECAGVIKADAYGLGLEQIMRRLGRSGCRTFFVATLDEGRRARLIQPGATIYILDGLAARGRDILRRISTCGPASAAWRKSATGCLLPGDRPAAACSAPHRQRHQPPGLPADRGRSPRRRPTPLRDFDISLVMSHLACADEPDSPMNRRPARDLRSPARCCQPHQPAWPVRRRFSRP